MALNLDCEIPPLPTKDAEVEATEDTKMLHAPDDSMFTSADALSDVTLMVEGRPLHVSRCVLSLASPVFKKMFEGEFKDKTEIPLVDKNYNDVVEVLLYIYPSTMKMITKSNVDAVLRLADEYGMEPLKERCGQVLLQQLLYDERYNNPSNEELVHVLYLADKYKLEELIEACVQKGKVIALDGDNGLNSFPDYQLMSTEVKLRICSARLSNLEEPIRKLIAFNDSNSIVLSNANQQTQSHSGFGSFGTVAAQPAFNTASNECNIRRHKTLSDMVSSLSIHFHNHVSTE